MSLFDHSEKPIGIASDHAGFERKQGIIKKFEELGIPYKDFGTYSSESTDYPTMRIHLLRLWKVVNVIRYCHMFFRKWYQHDGKQT